MTEQLKRKLGDMLVATTAMAAIAQVLMRRTIETSGDQTEMTTLREEVVRKLKNAEIEQLGYDQQAKLISRALEVADKFFDHYTNRLLKKPLASAAFT
jgi:ABC-type transport system involved in cytochrome bd biosynthesis fused ATPase/permease subunit